MKIMCAVRDIKAEAYGRPMFIETTGIAIRGFVDAVRAPQSPMSEHPEDYMLFELGKFDPSSGKVECLPEPKFLMAASDVAVKEDPRQMTMLENMQGVEKIKKEAVADESAKRDA